jgi:hypothetical protein
LSFFNFFPARVLDLGEFSSSSNHSSHFAHGLNIAFTAAPRDPQDQRNALASMRAIENELAYRGPALR